VNAFTSSLRSFFTVITSTHGPMIWATHLPHTNGYLILGFLKLELLVILGTFSHGELFWDLY